MPHKTLTHNTLKAMVGLRVVLGGGLFSGGPCTIIDFIWPDCTLVLLSESGRILHGISVDDVEIHKDDQERLIERLVA